LTQMCSTGVNVLMHLFILIVRCHREART